MVRQTICKRNGFWRYISHALFGVERKADLLEGLVVRPDAPAVAEHLEDTPADHGDAEADEAPGGDGLDGVGEEGQAEEGNEEQVRGQGRAVGPVRPVERACFDRTLQATVEPEGEVLGETGWRDVQSGDQLCELHGCSRRVD
jgi:hypothetical protein